MWSREVVESPSLTIFKSHLDTIQGNLQAVARLEQMGWTSRPPEVPADLSHSVILMPRISKNQDGKEGEPLLPIRYLRPDPKPLLLSDVVVSF